MYDIQFGVFDQITVHWLRQESYSLRLLSVVTVDWPIHQ